MEVDTKTLVIVALGVLLVFMIFAGAGPASNTGSNGYAAYSQSGYGAPQGGASNIKTLNDLPSMVGGC